MKSAGTSFAETALPKKDFRNNLPPTTSADSNTFSTVSGPIRASLTRRLLGFWFHFFLCRRTVSGHAFSRSAGRSSGTRFGGQAASGRRPRRGRWPPCRPCCRLPVSVWPCGSIGHRRWGARAALGKKNYLTPGASKATVWARKLASGSAGCEAVRSCGNQRQRAVGVNAGRVPGSPWTGLRPRRAATPRPPPPATGRPD